MRALPERYVLTSQRLFTAEGLRPGFVAVSDQRIHACGPLSEKPVGVHAVDVGHLAILPGVVDTHVHVNQPGRTEWEGFVTASRAAAAGGITSLVDMPLNSIPVTTSLQAFQVKRAEGEQHCAVDFGLWGGVVPGNAHELTAMIEAGALGFKCFLCHSGIDDFPASTEADLRMAMPILARHGIPLLVHAELIPDGTPEDDPLVTSRRYHDYLQSRPRAWEDDAIRLMIRLCRETGCQVHIVHLSSADALPDLAAAKAEGLPISVETCPHYLFFDAESIPDGATHFKCAPPIREAENRERLWEGLLAGTIDFVVCDHSPCTPNLKLLDAGDFLHAWGGIASLQLSPSIIWTCAQDRGIDISRVLDWLTRRPARFAGLADRKGALAPGFDADLAVWDLEARTTLEPQHIRHRHPLTPYLQHTLQGQVHTTLLRGRPLFHEGQQLPGPGGQLLRRHSRE